MNTVDGLDNGSARINTLPARNKLHMETEGATRLTLWQNFIRFGIVGVAAVLSQALVFMILTHNAQLSGFIANTVGAAVSFLVSYVGQSRWTFSDREEKSVPRFAFIALATLSIGNGSAWLIVDRAHASPYWVLPIILLVVPTLSFLLMRSWAFRYCTADRGRNCQPKEL